MIAFLLAGLLVQAAPQRDVRPLPAAAAATISGTITTADTLPRPLRRVRVTITGPALETPRTVITGDDGRFALTGLPAGRYTVGAAKEGYVPMAYGATRTARPGRPVTVTDGGNVSVTVRLPRGAVITGTVLDVDGQPAAGVIVSVLARRFAGGAPGGGDYRYVPAGAPLGATTDDRGVYRVYALPPGDYVVSAQPVTRPGAPPGTVGSIVQVMPRGRAAGSSRNMLLTQIFHPATPDLGRAARVTVRAGEERSGVDVQLEYVPVATIRGTTNLSPGFGPPRVTLWRTDELARPQTGPVTTADDSGRFQFASIAPGQYRIIGRAVPASESSGGRGSSAATNVQYALADVVVNGDDVDVALTTQPALSISGHVVFESDRAAAPQLPPAQLRINMPALAAGAGGWPLPPVVIDGAGFRIDGIVPGLYRTTPSLQGIRTPIGAWWLKSIVVNGRDILDAPLDLREGSDDAVATFTDRASEVAGTVKDAQGVPAADTFVVVFPIDRAGWFSNSRRIAGARTGSDGRYTIRNLPPGEYRIAAASDLEPGEWFDPAVLERLLPEASPVGVRGPEKYAVELVIR